MNLFKVLLNWGKIAAALAAAIPELEALALNDHEAAGAVILSWGDVEDLVNELMAEIPDDLRLTVEPKVRAFVQRLATRFAERLDKIIPEEAILAILPH